MRLVWICLAAMLAGAPLMAQEAEPADPGESEHVPFEGPPEDDGGGVVIAPLSAQTARRGATDPGRGAVTNLPLPRFVSLKGSKGNARRGPSLSHRVDWEFRHAGMPLRVTAEYGQWRRVVDQDGAGGWVHYSLLSGVRTVLVQHEMADLRASPREDAGIRARAEAGAILKLDRCEEKWCEVTGGGVSGWLPEAQIWGDDSDLSAPK